MYGLLLPMHIYAQTERDSLKFYYNSIVNPTDRLKITKAFEFYNKRIDKSLQDGDTIGAVQDLRLMIRGQFELGLYNESEQSATRALRLLDQLPVNSVTTEAKYAIYNDLGLIYKELKAEENALNYFNNALQLAVKTEDSIRILNNIANVYSAQKKYHLAVEKFSVALNLYTPDVGILTKALILDNLGYNQSKTDHPEALENLRAALEIRTKNQDLAGMYSSNRFLATYYLDREQKNEALTYANEAYRIANQINSITYIENALSLLIAIENDPKVVRYTRLRDSITLAKQQEENRYAFLKYNVEEANERFLKAELERQRQQKVFLIVILIIVMGTVFIVYYKNQQRKRAKELATYETETRLSKKVHDEFANDISGIMTLIANTFSVPEGEKDKLLNYLNDLYVRSRDISTQIAGIDIGNFSESLKGLIVQYHTDSVSVITNPITAFPWHKIADHTKIAIYRSLQELLINTKKHAKATEITIAIKQDATKNKITYTDNGIGFDLQEQHLNGLYNVETRMRDIGGKFTFESQKGKGFKANLIF